LSLRFADRKGGTGVPACGSVPHRTRDNGSVQFSPFSGVPFGVDGAASFRGRRFRERKKVCTPGAHSNLFFFPLAAGPFSAHRPFTVSIRRDVPPLERRKNRRMDGERRSRRKGKGRVLKAGRGRPPFAKFRGSMPQILYRKDAGCRTPVCRQRYRIDRGRWGRRSQAAVGSEKRAVFPS